MRVIDRQEAGHDIGRRQAGGRIERKEGPGDQAGLLVEAGLTFTCSGVPSTFTVLTLVANDCETGRDGNRGRAELDVAELERGPVEVRVELGGDGHVLGGGGGLLGIVLEADGVGEHLLWIHKRRRAEAGRADQLVRVEGAGAVRPAAGAGVPPGRFRRDLRRGH